MLIQVSNKQRGFTSVSNDKLSLQMVYIEVDGEKVGFTSGDDLNNQLIAQGFEIEEWKGYRLTREQELVSFGNYLMSKYHVTTDINGDARKVSKKDLEDWREKTYGK